MADDEFRGYIIKFLLAGLFVVCLFTFASRFTANQGKDVGVIDDGSLDFDSLNSTISDTSEDAEAWGEAFRNDNIFVSAGAIVLFSIWGVGKLIWTSVISLFTLLLDKGSTVLGIPSMVLGVFSGILIICLIFSLWRVIKRGD